MIALSPGIAYGCFNLLRLADEHPMPFQQLRSELPRQGGMEVGRLLEVAQELHWLRANDCGIAVLTPAGARLLGIDLDYLKLRQALLDYVETIRPPWIKNAIDGRLKVLSFSPTEVAQSLIEAELARGYENDVVHFWDRLAAIARGLRNAELGEIGREGERLTLAFERERTGREPKWRSVESNSDGYDVLSVASASDLQQLPIEVKASRMGMRGTFHLTRNEWDATELMPLHQFHLWDLSKNGSPTLAVVSRPEVGEHVSLDVGEGQWGEVVIPFATFAPLFERTVGHGARLGCADSH
ncbi:DUF3883 domain-containing protein [Variovorax sp. PAMC 28711]|uniref:DUF3883 domain-containing protein n=1 Tax=Variovorax sp. PAMC 28711 TaxID=1795631 RepID=UPI00078EC1D0|nr:DUF3883 domain-containing protein [Variovorax sp. PAMC 28711]AMM23834.1 hypothetical protein AX767_05335 [Variovorax sp. PAMC 28711]